ncbi:MFS transporter [Allokutzneria sp. A3M-2-11 16]|uniref:MFS transporter n=1 Tax=Allokutzneria sp. A3M-2-11 16 TaxID=2962043 RepID=UPI0020B65DE6|nr:MFS transporter [Allokutzneria sp. A3M-2-11 16]MCP3804847.1 MFS transporter [Allokutzneria sp. A3M-2-11 16]
MSGTGTLRWKIIALAFLATTINYLDRANLGVSLPFLAEELGLSPATSGLVLGAFFWTYAAMQFPAGWLVDRFGPRVMLALAVLTWSLFTALTGLATGFVSLLVLRLLLGMGESPSYPANAKVVSLWFPAQERGLAASIFDSGARFGTALALPLITLVIAASGWRTSFFVTGAVGIVFVVLWLRVYQDPDRHPKLTPHELTHIRGGEPTAHEAAVAVPWRTLFRYRATWGMSIGIFCVSFVLYFFITWFPSYLVAERGFDLMRLGSLGAVPALLAMPAQWAGGLLQGRLIKRGRSVSFARKVPLVSGLVLSSVIVFAAGAPSATVALGLFTLSYCALGFAASSLWALPADLAPAPGNVASLAGIQGFASNLAGFVSPLLIGLLLGVGGSYVVPLAVAGAVSLLGALTYLVLMGPVRPLVPVVKGVPA